MKFKEHLKHQLITDKEYAITWLESILTELDDIKYELKMFVEALKEEQ